MCTAFQLPFHFEFPGQTLCIGEPESTTWFNSNPQDPRIWKEQNLNRNHPNKKIQLATFLTRYISFQGASRGKNIAVTNTVSLPARMHQVSDLRMNDFKQISNNCWNTESDFSVALDVVVLPCNICKHCRQLDVSRGTKMGMEIGKYLARRKLELQGHPTWGRHGITSWVAVDVKYPYPTVREYTSRVSIL